MLDRNGFEVKENDVKETIPWRNWVKYRDGYLAQSNCKAVFDMCRRYYRGIQSYEESNRPLLNLCREYAEKVTAKVVGTKWSVNFVTDAPERQMNKLDDFYDFQMKQMDDKEMTSRVALTGFVDGVAVVFTSYDEDTYGTKGNYRGYLKRTLRDFETCFFEDPYCEDPQEQRYLGYVRTMEIGAVKKLIEGSEKRKRKLYKLLLPDDQQIDLNENLQFSESEKITVVTRFFRDDNGEVVFEQATKYVNLYTSPHYLNPKKNYKSKIEESEDEGGLLEYENQGEHKYTLFTPAKKMSSSEYRKGRSKFWRYPISIFRPYPINNRVIGDSGMRQIIANQNIINWNFYLNSEDIKAHAMPKYLAKEGALDGQVIDNSPWQTIIDHTPFSNGTWGITRMGADTTSSAVLDPTTVFLNLTKQTNGFDNLASDNVTGDTSGYLYQQMVRQQNLTLEIPQERLWLYLKENARTDILYFRHYIDKAKYFSSMGDGEKDMQSRYQQMSQSLADAGQMPGVEQGTQLDEVRSIYSKEISADEFDLEWEVGVECQQGIAGSEITESQHYNQVFQQVSTSNLDPQLIKAFIECDPAFSRRVRSNLLSALEVREISLLAEKDAIIQQLQQAIQQMQQNLQFVNQRQQMMNQQMDAYKKAVEDNAQQNKAYAESFGAGGNLSEGEVKSNNAKGVTSDLNEFDSGNFEGF